MALAVHHRELFNWSIGSLSPPSILLLTTFLEESSAANVAISRDILFPLCALWHYGDKAFFGLSVILLEKGSSHSLTFSPILFYLAAEPDGLQMTKLYERMLQYLFQID